MVIRVRISYGLLQKSQYDSKPRKCTVCGVCFFTTPRFDTLFVTFWFTNVSPNAIVSPKISNDESVDYFFPHEPKRNQKTGKITIYLRVFFKSSKSESRLNAETSDLELLKWDPKPMHFKDRNNPLRYFLKQINTERRKFV